MRAAMYCGRKPTVAPSTRAFTAWCAAAMVGLRWPALPELMGPVAEMHILYAPIRAGTCCGTVFTEESISTWRMALRKLLTEDLFLPVLPSVLGPGVMMFIC